MYELRFHPQVDKELALLPKQVRKIIKDEKMSGGLKSSATCVFTAGNRSYDQSVCLPFTKGEKQMTPRGNCFAGA